MPGFHLLSNKRPALSSYNTSFFRTITFIRSISPTLDSGFQTTVAVRIRPILRKTNCITYTAPTDRQMAGIDKPIKFPMKLSFALENLGKRQTVSMWLETTKTDSTITIIHGFCSELRFNHCFFEQFVFNKVVNT